MALKFDNDAARQLAELKAQLAIVLHRANQNHVEAAIAAFALVQLARELLDKYPAATQEWLVDGTVIPFLKHEPLNASSLLS